MVTVFKRDKRIVLMEDKASPGDPCLIIPIEGDTLLEIMGALIGVYSGDDERDIAAYFGVVLEGEA